MNKQKASNFRGKVLSNARKNHRNSGGSNYLTPPKGVSLLVYENEPKKVKLDFLPYLVTDAKHPDRDDKEGVAIPGSQWYRRPFKLHRNVGGAKGKSYVCLSSVGKKCPICEYQTELFKTDRDGAIALYPKDRVLYVVIPIGDKNHEEIPYIWDMSVKLFHEQLQEQLEEDDENETFPELENGKTLELTFKWKGIGDGKPFPETRHIDFEDREPYDESILDEVPNLDEVLNVLSYDELNAKFLAIDDDDEPEKEEEKEEQPKQRKRNSPFKEQKEEEPEITWEQLVNKSERSLIRLIEKKELEINTEDYDENELRIAVAEELGIDIPIKKEKPTRERKTSVKEETEQPKTRSSRTKKEEKPIKEKCPYKHTFGVDSEKFDDCENCDIWRECLDEKEK